MTAAERILRDWTDETPRGGFDVDGSRIDLRDGVQCARDYYEACRLLMRLIVADDYDSDDKKDDAVDDAIKHLRGAGFVSSTGEWLWDKLPKEET